MPGITATQNLPYLLASDAPKDQGKVVRDLAVATDYRLRSHDVDVARSQVPPFALVERTTQNLYLQSLAGNVELFDFETVLEDTDGMVSLENDSRVITLTRQGWWNIGIYAKLLGTSCNPGFAGLVISDESNDVVNDLHDAQVGFVAGSSEWVTKVTTPGVQVTSKALLTGSNCAASVTMLYGRMWAYWVRDL